MATLGLGEVLQAEERVLSFWTMTSAAMPVGTKIRVVVLLLLSLLRRPNWRPSSYIFNERERAPAARLSDQASRRARYIYKCGVIKISSPPVDAPCSDKQFYESRTCWSKKRTNGFLTRFNDTGLYVVFSFEYCLTLKISRNGCSLLFLTSKY